MGYIYKTTNLINGKMYIGSSKKNPKDNWSYYGSGRNIVNAIKKYGKENFTKEILVESNDNIRLLEKQYLENVNARYNLKYYNMTNDALGNDFHSNDTKKSISEKLKGRKMPPEQIKKIRLAKTGKPNSKKGKPDGPKPSVSKAHKGRVSPNKGKSKQVALYKTSGEYVKTYPNYTTLASYLNINPETVRCQLVGKANTICNKQYKAQYV
jgi:group I intron endonuclease